ncbi:hypothetical protein GCM10027098_11690 [Bowmanella dokdonensis]
MKNTKLVLIVASSLLAQSCASVEGGMVTQQAAKQTIEHQQAMDKEDGRDRSSEIKKESLINGGIAALWCALKLNDECKGND